MVSLSWFFRGPANRRHLFVVASALLLTPGCGRTVSEGAQWNLLGSNSETHSADQAAQSVNSKIVHTPEAPTKYNYNAPYKPAPPVNRNDQTSNVISPPANPPRIALGNAEGRSVLVQRGDTLHAISRRTGTSVRMLQSLNKLNSDVIHPGQRLLIR